MDVDKRIKPIYIILILIVIVITLWWVLYPKTAKSPSASNIPKAKSSQTAVTQYDASSENYRIDSQLGGQTN